MSAIKANKQQIGLDILPSKNVVLSTNTSGELIVSQGNHDNIISEMAKMGTSYIKVPSGTTAQRPSSPVEGMIRFNTDTGKVEEYENGSWENRVVTSDLSGSTGSALVGFLQAGTGASARTVQAKLRDVVSVKDFGAVGDGVTDDAAAIQAAIDEVGASGGGVVFFPAGVYIIGATIYLRQGVFLLSIGRSATIKQKTAGGLNVLVDFNTHSAHYAGIDGLIVDGDLTNNQKDVATERFAVFVGAANYASVINTKVRNYAGHGVYVSSGMHPIVNDNILENLYFYGVYINPPVLSDYNKPEVCRNLILDVSWHAIMVTRSRQARICDNTIKAKGFHGHVVTVSGTTCTLVSGTDFSGVKPGNFLIYDGGIEALVSAVNSPTQLTLSSATGNRTAVAGATGAADVITSMGCQYSLIRGNLISGGASLGISVFANEGYGNEIHPKVVDNTVEAVGSAGFSVQSNGAVSTTAPLFDGNTAAYCGLNASAADANFNSGLTVSGACDIVTVINNSWHAFGSSMYGLNILTTGAVVRAADNVSNTTIKSIQNGATVVLSAGWNGATVSELVVGEDTLSFLVTTTSTAPSASPSITITHRVRPLRNKVPTFTLLLTSASILSVQTFFPLSDTTSVGVMAGTPSPSSTYRFVVRL